MEGLPTSAQAEGTPLGHLQLPEILQNVLSHFGTLSPLYNCALVNSHWAAEAIPILWKGSIRDFFSFSQMRVKNPNMTFLEKLSRGAPRRFEMYFSHIRYLTLYDRHGACPDLFNSCWRSNVSGNGNYKALNLSFGPRGLPMVGDELFHPGLRLLSSRWGRSLWGRHDDALFYEALQRRSPDLQWLSLWNHGHGVHPDPEDMIVPYLHNACLQGLELSTRCVKIVTERFWDAVLEMPSLRHLHLIEVSEPLTPDIVNRSQHKMRSIRSISVPNTRDVLNEETLPLFVPLWSNTLRRLHLDDEKDTLRGSRLPDENTDDCIDRSRMLDLVSQCHALEDVYVKTLTAERISREALEEVINGCPSMRSFVVRTCDRVLHGDEEDKPISVLELLVTRWPNLNRLTLELSFQGGTEAIDLFARHLPKLLELRIGISIELMEFERIASAAPLPELEVLGLTFMNRKLNSFVDRDDAGTPTWQKLNMWLDQSMPRLVKLQSLYPAGPSVEDCVHFLQWSRSWKGISRRSSVVDELYEEVLK